MSRPGYWATHNYTRGSVIRDSDSFMGYGYLERNVFGPLVERNGRKINRGKMYQAIVAALFETGGRIGEVLQLQRENFSLKLHKDLVVVRRMPLLKRYKKIVEYWEVRDSPPVKLATGKPKQTTKLYKNHNGKYRRKRWETERIDAKRDFSYLKSEPLHIKYLLPWLKKVNEGLLFPTAKYNAVYMALYNLKVEPHKIYATPKFYNPHWFRGQRAVHLRLVYGFDYMALKEFFEWESSEMAEHYAKLGGISIGEKMLRRIQQRNE